MEGRFAVTGLPHNPRPEPLRALLQARPPRTRGTVEWEQLFFSGLSVAMLVVQVAGFIATYAFLAHTSERALWPTPPAPPVMVEISR
jgi:hypothetical protein